MARKKYEPGPEPEYFRHTGMPQWGACILLSRTMYQRTYLFADGNKRTFKESFCEWHFEPLAEPPSDEDRAKLLRGASAGGVGTPKAIHLDLEAEIKARPDDPGPYLVYADWLQNKGDPRGHLITVQAQLLETPDDKKLRDAEKKIFAEHGAYLVPPALAALLKAKKTDDPKLRTELEWKYGFLSHVRLARKKAPAEAQSLAEIAASVLDHPSSTFLRSLTIGPLGEGNEHSYIEMIEAITKRARPHLAELVIGDFADIELAFSRAGNVSQLLPALPGLHSLTLRAGSLRFDNLVKHDELRELHVIANELLMPTLRRLLSAKLPKLETLELSCPGLALDLAELKTLLATTSLPKLRHLVLRQTTNTRGLLDEIAASPMLAQLETLVLSGGDLDDADAEAIAKARGKKLATLASLDLANNRLSTTGVQRLAKLCKGVHAAPSNAPLWGITDADVIALAPDAQSMTAARKIAQPSKWFALARDGNRLWGEYDGSDNYYVHARLDLTETGCNCASPKDPCKHVLALLLIAAAEHPIPIRTIPAAFLRRTYDRPRYGRAWE